MRESKDLVVALEGEDWQSKTLSSFKFWDSFPLHAIFLVFWVSDSLSLSSFRFSSRMKKKIQALYAKGYYSIGDFWV